MTKIAGSGFESGSGSKPKCHGSGPLKPRTIKVFTEWFKALFRRGKTNEKMLKNMTSSFIGRILCADKVKIFGPLGTLYAKIWCEIHIFSARGTCRLQPCYVLGRTLTCSTCSCDTRYVQPWQVGREALARDTCTFSTYCMQSRNAASAARTRVGSWYVMLGALVRGTTSHAT